MITFGQLKASTVANISGVVPSGAQFRDLANEAVQRLLVRGDWSGTLQPIQVCVSGGCVSWPRYVGNVRRINACGYPLSVRNVWNTFLQFERRGDCNNWNGWVGGWTGWLQGELYATGQGRYSTHTDIMGDGRYVRAYPQLAADIGKKVRILGVDNNNQPLRTTISGVTEEGIVLTLAPPYVQSTIFVRRIDRVVKDVTQGNITLYAYNAADAVLEDLATYEPSETSPSYVREKLQLPCGTGCCGSSTQSIIALIKLAYIPASQDSDLIVIDNLGALKLMMMSLKFEEAGDRADARAHELDAIRELNRQLADDSPDEQVPVSNEPFNGVWIEEHRLF